MSGFQIPGLGQAQPSPLPTDQPQSGSTTDAQAVQSHNDNVVNPDATTAEQPEGSKSAVQSNREQPTTSPSHAIATVPATSAAQNEVVMGDSTEPLAPEAANSTDAPAQQQDAVATDDAMMIDRPASPPSLTSALEAALGGLQGDDAEVTLPAQQGNSTNEQQPAQQDTAPATASENPEFEVDSSPYVSSDSSSDSSDDEDSDNEGYELLGVEETARMLMEAEGGSDDEGDKGGKSGAGAHLRTKNELPEETIPRPDVTITPEMKIEELGAVEHVVENMILIKAFTPGEYQVLDTGSVVCNEERVVIGAIAETIGKVLQPMYTMHFNSAEEIKELGVQVGTKVFYPAEHASFVFTEPLKSAKGTDASNIHDEEVPEDEMEFSDDEKEAEYKRALKEKKRKKHGATRGGREQPATAGQGMGPSGELNYDDDDGPYKPLSRPPGFGSGPVSQEEPGRPSHRGRGRGDARGGRGSRGRGGRGGGGGGGGHSGPRDGFSAAPQGYQQQHHNQHQQQQYPQPPQQQQSFQPPPPPGWNGQAPAQPPAMPNFGFQFPGWPQPQPGQQHATPPPPPGWPGAVQAHHPQQQEGGNSAFMNPALIAALVNQMQGQNQQGGQQPQWPQQPPGQ
ncbi:H/ACA ribonucleoprotein complex non-core subunit-like protein [Emericellopsis cladophorae]|uniref:H/ACA ribonucleoprotein complex non-core subunit NAF1 n=1 Tax=Emericellopsis cladophorae TaxID=2686198 RepID=A0A9P9Y874_9HYPO|nr:H/ACA ribonucleoprotein complex non-core subunit-like protein [Emericellopsis cladophorae]KAI6785236.1 H/ACA ribonucleoprotein complex non-core subunit-like protein [Emericellopsis cladophorae]